LSQQRLCFSADFKDFYLLVLDNIKNAPQAVIERVFCQIFAAVDQHSHYKQCRHETNGGLCDTLSLSSLIQKLAQLNCWSLPKRSYYLSVATLVVMLRYTRIMMLCFYLSKKKVKKKMYMIEHYTSIMDLI
jgi:hypothetical protein